MRSKAKTILLPLATALATALALAACTTTPPAAEVTRFHLGQPIPSDSIAILPAPGMDGKSLEFRTYVATIGNQLNAVGLHPADNDGRNAYLGLLTVEQTTRPGLPRQSPFRIGFGGSTGGSSGGVGGGVSVPVGGSTTGDVRVNVVALQIKRRSDNSMVWEGRAVQEIAADAPAAALANAVPALASALLADFPGPTGQTVKVKLPK